MSRDLVIVGAGGFGREVADVVDAVNSTAHAARWRLLGFIDDAPTEENLTRIARRGAAYLGSVSELMTSTKRPHFVVGIGSPGVRRRISEGLEERGFEAATLVHPAATVGENVAIGPGTVICAGARLTTNIKLGHHVHVNPNATIGHDTTVGQYVSLNPLASISGDCMLEDEVLVGVAAAVLNGLTLGRGATVGGCACVVRDVQSYATVKGVPAK